MVLFLDLKWPNLKWPNLKWPNLKWLGPGSNRRPHDFQSRARTN